MRVSSSSGSKPADQTQDPIGVHIGKTGPSFPLSVGFASIVLPLSLITPSTHHQYIATTLRKSRSTFAMTLLALPTEVLEIIIHYLNGPEDTRDAMKLHSSTTCLCKRDLASAKDPETYPIWRAWKRDSLALSSVAKRLRSLIFDQFWLKKIVLDWDGAALKKTKAALCATSREKVQ
jgi:hypothetical protein